ncbi:MAG: hypothetical protein R2798_02600 [Chitinophagales bacterium]|nr:hypothetical protein [Bacteroidota bacterium]MCB9042219.1 hypothetical protein [Chitinophagales bacterium]
MTAIIKFILILMLIYYGLKLVFQAVIGRFLTQIQNKQQEFYYRQKEQNHQEGEMTVHTNQSVNTEHTANMGEYIDYEEVAD